MKPSHIGWSRYLRNGVGRRLSQIGEKTGFPWLVYNPFVMSHFHEMAMMDAPQVVPPILSVFPASQRFLDVGSGSGAFSAEINQRGRRAIALERSPYGRKIAIRQGVDCRPFDLLRTPAAEVPESIDVVLCFEVAEHLTAHIGERLVTFNASFRAPIVFSAAQPGQGGTGHLNEQPWTHWLQRFEKLDFTFAEEITLGLRNEVYARRASPWFANNLFVVVPN